MTTQEIREMLDSTINSNGSRGISGKSLNSALNSVVDLVEEVSTSRPVIDVDRHLNTDSNNPISNSAVSMSINDLNSRITDVQQGTLVDIQNAINGIEIPLIMGPIKGGSGLKDMFVKYDLENKLNQQIACFLKEESYSTPIPAFMTIEGFDDSGDYAGTSNYKVTFVLSPKITSQVMSLQSFDEDRSYDSKYLWNPDVFSEALQVKSYLYMKSSNMVMNLSEGKAIQVRTKVVPERLLENTDNLDPNYVYYGLNNDNKLVIKAEYVLLERYDQLNKKVGSYYQWIKYDINPITVN